jgi:stearoyl-CoA desaturase (delta-9 desaturase)
MPTSREQIDRFKDFPEIIWLNQYHGVGFIFWVALLFGIQALFPASFGTDQLLVSGFFVPTFFILQGTCLVNSVCHLAPKRQEDTKDYSTNNPWLFPIALGENWHRNHHLYPASASTWVKPYQVDIIYLTIKALEWVGLVWDVKTIKPKREKVWNPST